MYTNMVQAVSTGIAVFDRDRKAYFVNPYLLKRTGYEAEEVLGDNFLEILVNEKLRSRIEEKIITGFEKPFHDVDAAIMKKDGTPVPMKASGEVFDTEDGPRLVIVFQDISSQNAYEKVIETSFDNFIQTTIDLDTALKKIKEQRQILEEYKLKMTRELFVAKNVQKAIIPKVFPDDENITIWGTSIPSEELGGDYFDFFQIDKKSIGILVADVSGHGVPSSLITTMVKAYFEYFTKRYKRPEKVLNKVNKSMTDILSETGFYLTAIYAVADFDRGVLTVSSAGHDAALCFVNETDPPDELSGEGTILGSFEDAVYTANTYKIKPGSRLIMFTDGITEARSDTGEFYGNERLIEFMRSQSDHTPEECGVGLIQNINCFYGENGPNDDRTFVIVDLKDKMAEKKTGKSFEDYYNIGLTFLKQRDFYNALLAFKTASLKRVDNPNVFHYLGQTQSFLGFVDEAEESFFKALELKPDFTQNYYYLGIVEFNKKNYAKAEEYWKKVLTEIGEYKNTKGYLEKVAIRLKEE